MVELYVGQDGGVGKVVEELGALVEEGGVVLVAFEDEGAGVGVDAEAGAEVFGYASDQEGGGEVRVSSAGYFVNPGEHAGGGGLAVGAAELRGARGWLGISSWISAAMEVMGMRLSRDEFELGVAAGDGVAYYYQVWRGG